MNLVKPVLNTEAERTVESRNCRVDLIVIALAKSELRRITSLLERRGDRALLELDAGELDVVAGGLPPRESTRNVVSPRAAPGVWCDWIYRVASYENF